jgi:hypothetical protein
LIPVATTTVRVERRQADPDVDPYENDAPWVTVASGVRAHISTGRGQEDRGGSDRSIVHFRMACDQFDGGILHTDRVVDEQSGEVYEVRWAVARSALGLDHFHAGLDQISGVVTKPLVGGF